MKNGDYQSPIQVLYSDIITSFTNKDGLMDARLLSLLSAGKVSSYIDIIQSATPIKTPQVALESGLITLHESFLCYLWSVTFTHMAILTYVWERAGMGETHISVENIPELCEAEQLMRWAASLKHNYSHWSEHLPSPKGNSQQIIIVNGIFINAVKYIIYHELAHLSNNHKVYSELVNKTIRTEDEVTLLKQLETEADNYAFDCLIVDDKEEIKLLKGVAICIAQLSSLYLVKNIAQLIQLSHPDIDTRIFNVMQKVKSDNALYQTGINLIHNIGLTLFINHLPRQYITEDLHIATFEELLSYLYTCLDEVKDDINNS